MGIVISVIENASLFNRRCACALKWGRLFKCSMVTRNGFLIILVLQYFLSTLVCIIPRGASPISIATAFNIHQYALQTTIVGCIKPVQIGRPLLAKRGLI